MARHTSHFTLSSFLPFFLEVLAAVKWVREMPLGDRGLIFSFFKSGLDLIEGALVHEFKTKGVYRFDGDLNGKQKEEALDNFKADADGRVLLATVASGGTGLNITEANHVS